jgi:Asp-tRNA(Asn)/Glu-tRNA(Gln) amidotransferase A subunit family amidase
VNDILHESLSTMAKLIRARKVSPVECAEVCLARIDKLNPTLNAIATVPPDLLDCARLAETALMRGNNPGCLFGVPLTIKDTFETAGLRSTSGSFVRADFVPQHDAAAVARLKAAGAIILAKTNTAEMAMDYTADNLVFGRTNNPYDLARTPGGSSGGEAVAISTGMSPGGLGSDLAGSIRIPAHFCGIAGLKPTTGTVSGRGQFPPSFGPYSLGAVVGPMARRVEDLKLIFRALAAPRQDSSPVSLKGTRVAWYVDDGIAPVSEETKTAVANAVRALADGGLVTEERRPPNVDRGHELWLKLFSRASVVQLREVYAGFEEEAGAFVSWRLKTADDTPTATLDEFISSWIQRDRLREKLLDWMEEVPLILAPVGATPAFLHDARKVNVAGRTISTFRAFSYSQTFNVFDLPVVVVPAGRSGDGLPIGVQIIGRPNEEETVLAAGAVVEEALGGWQMPELFDEG